ncbi:MAG: GntR family transcriptional regulator [Chelatococcus sp.]|jgi:GntR family transcriptional regulator|uniref:GntR family transcriptional regulator n=1 Tax=unclassified Chelatococcus TaxID=2638111 RepID=UPI001BCAEC6D|nr:MULTISPECIES: GntR family transcriptional regulator [unclassified Chelatococcus]CAH1670550.1 GntR family transcriptional regulator [Hyphomicrobiales bacterium]MBS7739189.1 GntR family transcriptional regulator [Chelatococcus sp. HY11]MBX3540138.1 GntR family transcriptional regulator [Chelatococcus sp.]MBX3543679.1 GntR family transcriptional regulator [Chelatococcus sp.]MCO5076278.1 GntR family transcriptional regulator [Chelatococcus sp.]
MTEREDAMLGRNRPFDSDPNDRRPLYVRLREALLERIASGEWVAGASLPSEQALSSAYGVAQGTLRKTLDTLVSEGKLVRRHGKGTFVATYNDSRALSHLLRLVGRDGRREIPTARMISHVKDEARKEEAERLQLRARAKVIRIERVRFFADQPVIWERLALPFAMFPDLEPSKVNELPPHLYEHFGQQYGILVRDALEDLRAVAADEPEASHLLVQRGFPLLEIDRLIYGFNDRPIEWRVSRCVTTDLAFRTETR